MKCFDFQGGLVENQKKLLRVLCVLSEAGGKYFSLSVIPNYTTRLFLKRKIILCFSQWV
jgi:hypothetical protein